MKQYRVYQVRHVTYAHEYEVDLEANSYEDAQTQADALDPHDFWLVKPKDNQKALDQHVEETWIEEVLI